MTDDDDESTWKGEGLRQRAVAEIDGVLWFPLRQTCKALGINAEWAVRYLFSGLGRTPPCKVKPTLPPGTTARPVVAIDQEDTDELLRLECRGRWRPLKNKGALAFEKLKAAMLRKMKEEEDNEWQM